MSVLPTRFAQVILCFAGLFCQRTWQHAQLLLKGAVLVPGARTVASVLRVLGLAGEAHFVNFHRVLSRAVWSPRTAAHVLLGLLVRTFVPEGPIVLGIDDTIERRRGQRIAARGIYRDPVRSSRSHFVKASGLRWISVMLLAPISWAHRVWALPVLTALAPSERYDQEHHRRHKTLTDHARQLLCQVWRWLPGREVVRRLKLLGTGIPRGLGSAHELHHPAASGCTAVCAAPTAQAWPTGSTSAQGRALAEFGRCPS